jgi:hypothetical protein
VPPDSISHTPFWTMKGKKKLMSTTTSTDAIYSQLFRLMKMGECMDNPRYFTEIQKCAHRVRYV